MKHGQGRRKKSTKAVGDLDGGGPKVNGEMVRSAVNWALGDESFGNIKHHGNTSWRLRDLIVQAVLWVWSEHSTLEGAFQEAHGWSLKLLGRAALSTYQGLLGALVTITPALLPQLWARLQELMLRHGGGHERVGGWLPLAVDGSRVGTPRTEKNEKAFCAPNHGHSATARFKEKKRRKLGVPKRKKAAQPPRPQIWVTLVWHMGLRLLWCWRTGPSNSSERSHLLDLLDSVLFPIKSLFCCDAGFVGYDFWSAIADKGHHFLIRVGSNVRLLRGLAYTRQSGDIVYCWPDKAARKKQPPLALRLLSLRIGQTPVYLVTNVLDPHDLTNEMACKLYQMRWGIELQFRTFKQTFGRRQLRCKTPERALRELDWSLVGLWMIQLFATKEQIAIGEPPSRSSVSLAIQAIRDAFRNWSEVPPRGQHLQAKLQAALIDQYPRSKKSKRARYRPDNKDKPAAGKPVIINASKKHKLLLKQYLATAA